MVDNSAIDDERLCVPDIGLLTILLRCRDGYDITVEEIARRHAGDGRRGTGLSALEAAMRNLVRLGYVVKIKSQDERGHWRTDVAAFPTPAAADEVAAVLAAEFPRVTAYRIEPEHLAPDPAKPQVATDMALSGGRLTDPREGTGSLNKKKDKTSDKTCAPAARIPPARSAAPTGSGARERVTLPAQRPAPAAEAAPPSPLRGEDPTTSTPPNPRTAAAPVEHVLIAVRWVTDLLTPAQRREAARAVENVLSAPGQAPEALAERLRDRLTGSGVLDHETAAEHLRSPLGWLLTQLPDITVCQGCGRTTHGTPNSRTTVCGICQEDERRADDGVDPVEACAALRARLEA